MQYRPDCMQMDREAARLTAVDLVHDRLAADITHGKLQPGTRLGGDAIARDYGVSRTPVREAFRRLEAEGLVSVVPHVGAKVRQVSLGEIDELFEIRGALEVLAVQRAAERADDALVTALREQLQRCEAVPESDVERTAAENERLHALMYEAAGSPQLVRLIETLSSKLHRFRMASLSASDRPRKALDEHRRIAAAIAARDVRRARKLAMEHAQNGRIAATRWHLDHQRANGTQHMRRTQR
jgi:DNA-binding GntR family transcriptional regulator